MPDQLALPFGTRRLVRHTDPDTSRAAAEAATDLRHDHAHTVLACLRREARPLAAEQIADLTGLTSVQVARRWAELEAGGYVTPTQHRHINRSGRTAVRYALRRE